MPAWDVSFDMRLQTLHADVVSCIAKVHALASVIRQIPIPPTLQHRISALNILRAVRGTTGIEGAELTEDEVHQIMRTPPERPILPPNRRREEQEARNAEQLMYYVAREVTRNPGMPLTEDVVCKFHEIITGGIDYPNNTPGRYRSHPVRAGTYVPPRAEEEVRRLMREFISWFNEGPPSSWDSAIRAIVAHFYVVSIHPFGEGNGRTARGVESFLLYKGEVNARGFYSLANYYYQHREQYEHLLDYVRFETRNDLTPFVLFALRGLAEELEEVHRAVLSEVQWIAFRDYAREDMMLHDTLGSKVRERMLHFLFGLGAEPMSIKALRLGQHPLSHLYRNVTSKTLSRDLNFLRQHRFVIVEGDELTANLEVLQQFTPPFELAMQPEENRQRKS